MARKMKQVTVWLAILTVFLWLAEVCFPNGWWKPFAITASTSFYHFAMRLLVGAGTAAVMQNQANCHSFWFRPRKWEAVLYRKLRVKSWKDKLPTYDPESFNGKKHSLEKIAQTMCQAEVVHEIIAVLSFLPLLVVPYVGAFPVFLVTSLLAAAFDLSFVIIQRYNRPRILAILKKQESIRQR